MTTRAIPRHRFIRTPGRWALGALLGLGLLIVGPQWMAMGPAPAAAFCVSVPGIGGTCVRGPRARRIIQRRKRARIERRRRNSAPQLRAGQTAGARLTRIDPEVQTALNTVGFPVGRADGLNGRKTREGISDFQRAIDQPPTGTLTEAQKLLLMRAHATAVAQGIEIGPGNDGSFVKRVAALSAAPVAVAAAAVTADAATDQGGNETSQRPGQPGEDVPPVDEAYDAGATPTETASDDRPADDGTPADIAGHPAIPEATLSMTRTDDAMRRAEAASTPPSTGPNDMCNGIPLDAGLADVERLPATEAMLNGYCGVRDYLIDIVDPTTLGEDDGRGDLATCANWAVRTGLSADDLASLVPETVGDAFADRVPATRSERDSTLDIAKTCIGLAYRHDDPETGRFYALYAVAMADDGFGELVAVHHALGTEASDDPAAAALWYDWTADALDGGAPTVTGDDAAARAELLRVLAAKATELEPRPDEVPLPEAGSVTEGDGTDTQAAAEPLAPPPALMALADDAAADLPQIAKVLRLSAEELDILCDTPADDPIALRVCRILAYAHRDLDDMRYFDEALAELGDKVGEKAMSIWAWQDAPRSMTVDAGAATAPASATPSPQD